MEGILEVLEVAMGEMVEMGEVMEMEEVEEMAEGEGKVLLVAWVELVELAGLGGMVPMLTVPGTVLEAVMPMVGEEVVEEGGAEVEGVEEAEVMDEVEDKDL